ncbi:hypothetical protein KP509_07G013200 [Ceratopteris richardii]|uniref:Protein kinase domain-containing protein n=1 Tax=Ceratopteris richardii TaxID=49495 RepID=A0A8T2UA01_CERRI|nr:hypothetical protein KP509_07G013200 [Ceratopteris richardii]KAH7432203.1 hypothetical protein KP509_07G013200 [Ceratopteris richardii]
MAFLLCWSLFLLSRLSFLSYGSSLQGSERDALLQLKDILENPGFLSNWTTETDLCSIPPTSSLTVICEDGYVTRLQMVGNRPSSTSSSGNGMLSSSFSFESLILHLTNFSRLKVLQLSSLGIWGPLSSKLGRLVQLESLNMSSNFLSGVLPNRLMTLQNLQVLCLDDNMLNGSLPQKWSSLSRLSTLRLANNNIGGGIPSSVFSQLPSLQRLILDNNHLSGRVPNSLTEASNLQVLSLSGNQISGNLPDLSGLNNLMALNVQDNQIGPAFPPLSPRLLYVAMGKNKLQGPIPSSISILDQVRQLDLSSNLLSGVPPPALFSLGSIRYLNVARNRLSGSLPQNLSLAGTVKMLDFSFNLLTGHVPEKMVALLQSSGAASIRFQWNCLSTNLQPQNPFTFCQNAALASGIDPHIKEHQSESDRNIRIGILVGITAAVLAAAVASVSLLFVLIHRRRTRSKISSKSAKGGPCMGNSSICVSSELLANARYLSRTLKLGSHFRVFPIDELYKATDYFRESTMIGEGSRGKVYRGQLEDGSLVAIKRLKKEQVSSIKNVKARIERLAKVRHQHLVSLLGYNIAVEGDGMTQGGRIQVYLVYEYVSSRNLQTKLLGKGLDGFGWLQRLSAIIGAAKGIHFLHFGLVPGIFNNDIKIKNILLDQNMVSKISDYGLATPMDALEEMDGRPQMTKNLTPAENYRRKIVDKKDVYNFGLVLLEVLVGKPLACRGDGRGGKSKLMESFIADQSSRLDMIDAKILGVCNMESLDTVVDITVKCLSEDALGRPSMEDVLWNLQYAMQVQDCSSGGAQDEIGEGFCPSEVHAVIARKNMSTVGRLSNEEVGKPSSPNEDFFR